MARLKKVFSFFFFLLFLLSFSYPTFADDFNQYERKLLDIIYSLKSGNFAVAMENYDELRQYLGQDFFRDEKVLKESFPNLLTFFYPLEISDVVLMIEKELSHYSRDDVEGRTIFFFPYDEGKSSAFDIFFDYIFDFFDSFYITFDTNFDYFYFFPPSRAFSVVLNFAKDDFYVERNYFFIDFSVPVSYPQENHIFFLPHFSHFGWTLLQYIKREVGCSPIILYRKDTEKYKDILLSISWASGVSVSFSLEYSGIDIIPSLVSRAKTIAKKKNISYKSDKELLSVVGEEVDSSGCVIILDNSKNSAAIIPQLTFAGARKFLIFGFMWSGIKSYLEKRYYSKVFYADIVPYEEDRTSFYIYELKKIADTLRYIGEMYRFSKMTKIQGKYSDILLSSSGFIIRDIQVYRVDEKVEKVFEFVADKLVDKFWF